MEYPYKTFADTQKNSTGFGSDACAPLAHTHPNEAGTAACEAGTSLCEADTPRLVIRGESTYTQITTESGETFAVVRSNGKPRLVEIPKALVSGVASAALIDYFTVSFPFTYRITLQDTFARLFAILGREFSPAIDRKKGVYGYQHSFALGDTTAIFAYGGNRDTALLSLPGNDCCRIGDWQRLVNFLRSGLNARITRLDAAFDDFDGTHTVDHAVEMYRSQLFNAGGRKPRLRQSGNWLEPDGSGRTIYIGNRKNGKMLRVYEKGMQLGIPWHPWVRWEVEWHNRDRQIPWEAVLEPGKYLAGAYPEALAWVSEEQSRIRTLQKTAKIGYDSLSHWASVAYGKQIELMLKVEGSAERVVELLRRPGLPARLDLPSIPGYGKVYPPCRH